MTRKPVNLALQGGGSHGAFSWGVLDRLIEDDRLDFASVSGTSAGAMNAVALADGWKRGGRQGARERLEALWRGVARKGRFSPVQRLPWDVFWGNWSLENSPGYMLYDAMSRVFSPYMTNPLDMNPLREVVEEEIDFDNVRDSEVRVFVSATNVQSGRLRVFTDGDLGLDAVMASACLPQVFRAVEIDGEPYWDGGYGGNPALFPFFYANHVEDVLLVQINPVVREGIPKTAQEIQNRADEITFNSALLRELRAIAFVRKLIEEGRVSREEYRDIRMHRIDADEAFKDLSASSKVNAEWAFLEYLRDLGRTAAEDWLASNFDAVGKHATLDLSGELADSPVLQPQPLGTRTRQFLATRRKPAA